MSKEISSEVIIQASPEKVWNILTDFDNYPVWNPFIKFIKGDVKVGNIISVKLEPKGAQGMTFKPKVLTFEKNKSFTWLGNLWIKGLFDGENIFELIDNQDGTTTFIQREKFEGMLVPVFNKMLDNQTLNAFKEMNLKLKELAEK